MKILRKLFGRSAKKENKDPAAFRPIETHQAAFLTDSQIKHWNESGYLIIKGFYTSDKIDELNSEIDELWDDNGEKPPITMDIYCGPNVQRKKLKDCPLDARRHPYKLNDLYLESETVKSLALEGRLVAILTDLFRDAPMIVNSLNLEYGSQQRAHVDSMFSSPPDEEGLIATWIALEDITDGSGPLYLYPQSHLFTPQRFSNNSIHAVPGEQEHALTKVDEECKNRGLEKISYTPQKGDLLIWHGHLHHGGAAISDPNSTRRSLVTHYFRASSLPEMAEEYGDGAFIMRRDHQPVPGE